MRPTSLRRRLVAALLALAALVSACNGDGDDEARRDDREEEPDEPAGAVPNPGADRRRRTTTTAPLSDEDLDATVRELQRFVEAERGLAFREPVEARVATPEEFRERLLRDVEEEREEVERTEAVLRALGLIEADVDLFEVVVRFVGDSVVGAYFPDNDELWVRAGEGLSPYARVTLVHELVHALQDQHFDIDRPEYAERDDEIGFGFDALVEGDASLVEDVFLDELPPEERRAYRREEAAIGRDIDLEGVPDIVVQSFGLPYVLGPELVEAIREAGGQPLLDEAFADPPTTSEQVLHPDLYVERETAEPVQRPPADGEVVEDGMFGEVGILLLLQETEDVDPREAADGWAGDQYVVWQAEGQTCVRAVFVMESSGELRELSTALRRWAATEPDATVESRGGQLQLTACSA